MTLFQFYKEFDTDKKCIDYLIRCRWGDNISCPHCNHNKYYVTSADKRCKKAGNKDGTKKTEFKCANSKCYKKFSATTGTIFHATNVPLWQFFYLLFSTAINKKNVSATQQALNLGISQKTTWYIMMRIRMLCYQDENLKFDGEVEVDESYLASGKWRRRGGRVTDRKIPVLGLLERGGKVIVKVIPNKNKKTVQSIILKHVECGSELFTDTAACYFNMDSYYLHQTVNHRAGEYTRGRVYTNGIENFWTNIKSAIVDTHGGVSIEHLQRYIDEVVYRWNNKSMTPLEKFDDLLKRACTTKPIGYDKVSLNAKKHRLQKAKNKELLKQKITQ